MKHHFKWIILLICLVAPFSFTSCTSSMEEGDGFAEQPLTISDYGLFDLGVTDMNGDGRIDIYTANHSAVQGLLLNEGSGTFTDVYHAWKVEQDHRFPGLAVMPEEPTAQSPGIYINWVGADVVIRFHQLKAGVTAGGTLDVMTSIDIIEKQGVQVDVSTKEVTPGLDRSLVTFSGEGNGYFRFRPFNHALPFNFSFDESISPGMIHVGSQLTPPVSNEFTFMLRDRHGMAWADVNSDDHMDLFITRGGERDTMDKMPIPFWDELFMGTSDGMEDVGETVGLSKEGCPGRQAAWVDFNGDNLLDIYVVCGRGDGPHSNMLFRQTGDGRFEDVADDVGLDIETHGPFVWLDADGDQDVDLFWADDNGFSLYRNDAGIFSAVKIENPNKKKKYIKKLTAADFDNDGDLDIFAASMSGNTLLVNEDGNYSAVLPVSIGLPVKSWTANWVDYDNDGMMDLHAVPDGLYARQESGKYVSASGLGIKMSRLDPYNLIDARASWFDIDNNGTRDLVVSTGWAKKKNRLSKWYFKVVDVEKRFGGLDWFNDTELFRNNIHGNHWLEVELVGPPGNRQAVGSGVMLNTSAGRQRAQVGIAEGAHFGQGHYRLYFGLGKDDQPTSLRVDWPDGKTSEITAPSVDRLLKISWQES